MMPLKYFGYLAIVCAVLLDLYAGRPETAAGLRMGLDAVALLVGAAGLGGLALGPARFRRR
jgi:hypothetical protein